MSVESRPPAGSLRLGRVAGVPVYLDRTWLLLAAFIAWTGWQAGRDLGPGTAVAYAVWLVVGILVAVLGHEVAHAVAGRLLGFRVHRIVATLWGGHTAYDGTGSTPGRAALVAVSGPAANVALAALGALAMALLPWPYSEFAWSFVVLNGLLAAFNLLPGLPLDGGQLVESLVWGVTGRRDRGLLVAGWCGRVLAVLLVLGFVALPLAQGTQDVVSIVLALVMAWILWAGATAAVRRAPLERLLRQVRPEDVLEPVAVVPALTPVGELVGLASRVVALDERGLPTLLLPTPSENTPDIATLAPTTRLASLVVRLPDECVVELAPGADAEPLLRAMATTGWGVVVVTSAGAVRGLVTSERLNAVAEAVLRRN
ncbi:MAG TPA: site-2 protease family protein [Ornithinibacter sp.]|nr:site-2 protease family protein [Ornithinibacter sp.]